VFVSPAETARQLTLAIDDLWLGSRSHDLRFVFEAFPGKGRPEQRRRFASARPPSAGRQRSFFNALWRLSSSAVAATVASVSAR